MNAYRNGTPNNIYELNTGPFWEYLANLKRFWLKMFAGDTRADVWFDPLPLKKCVFHFITQK